MAISDSEHKRLKEHLDTKQWDQALEVAFELLESQPESSWLHTTMGSIYRKMNELSYAETSFKSAIYYQDTNIEAHTDLGFVYLDMGRIGTADDHCRQALGMDASYTPAWHLGFKIKLAYSDLPAARNIHATLRRHRADDDLLRALDFDLIRHPQNKQTVDYKSEIAMREALITEENLDHAIHGELAYFYNQYTEEEEKAKFHSEIALKKFPVKPNTILTSALIQRKSPLWLRILTAPILALLRPKDIPRNEVAIAGFTFILLFSLVVFGQKIDSSSPWIVQWAMFGIISMFFFSYTAYQAYLYLMTTEVYHQLDKTSLIKGSFESIHKLPITKRKLIICSLTFLSWVTLAALFYLLTR